MDKLSNGLGIPFIYNSWEIMCNANGVILPNRVCELGDIKAASGNLLARMQEFYNEQ